MGFLATTVTASGTSASRSTVTAFSANFVVTFSGAACTSLRMAAVSFRAASVRFTSDGFLTYICVRARLVAVLAFSAASYQLVKPSPPLLSGAQSMPIIWCSELL